MCKLISTIKRCVRGSLEKLPSAIRSCVRESMSKVTCATKRCVRESMSKVTCAIRRCVRESMSKVTFATKRSVRSDTITLPSAIKAVYMYINCSLCHQRHVYTALCCQIRRNMWSMCNLSSTTRDAYVGNLRSLCSLRLRCSVI